MIYSAVPFKFVGIALAEEFVNLVSMSALGTGKRNGDIVRLCEEEPQLHAIQKRAQTLHIPILRALSVDDALDLFPRVWHGKDGAF